MYTYIYQRDVQNRRTKQNKQLCQHRPTTNKSYAKTGPVRKETHKRDIQKRPGKKYIKQSKQHRQTNKTCANTRPVQTETSSADL